MSYQKKYIKYKSKYLQTKKILGGMEGNVKKKNLKYVIPQIRIIMIFS